MARHRRLEQILRDNGLQVSSGKNHPKIVTMEGKFVMPMLGSPSDHRAARNLLSDLKRSGYVPREVRL
jgi:hypothetical protein